MIWLIWLLLVGGGDDNFLTGNNEPNRLEIEVVRVICELCI